MAFSLTPKRLTSHRHYPLLLKFIRVLTLIYAFISLGFFIDYLVKTSRAGGGISNGNIAVIVIIALSLLYAFVSTFIICFWPQTGWHVAITTFLLDWTFTGSYIAVAVITKPKSGCGDWIPPTYIANGDDSDDDDDDDGGVTEIPGFWRSSSCRNTVGTFAMAIMSVMLYTAAGFLNQEDDKKNKNDEYMQDNEGNEMGQRPGDQVYSTTRHEI